MNKFILQRKLKNCGKNLSVDHGVRFMYPEKISIGDNVQLRACCQLYAQNNTMDKDKVKQNIVIKIGNNVHIKENANLSAYGGYINIGENSNIGHNCAIYGQGGITIGDNVLVGPNCSIISGNHRFDNPHCLINKQGTFDIGISIGNDVWVGANVSILDGVKIGNGAVIGAGAVVTHDVDDYCIVFGSPAKFYRKRGESK